MLDGGDRFGSCVRTVLLALSSTFFLIACPSPAPDRILSTSASLTFVGAQDSTFHEALALAEQGLRKFAKPYGWEAKVGVDEVRHFETKAGFDTELIKLSEGAFSSLPQTYVALMDGGILHVVSFAAYQRIHPGHQRSDYQRVLRHEIAHQLHVNLVGDEQMGPGWFFEGFAVVAAGQYQDDVSLDAERFAALLQDRGPAKYPTFGAMVRHLMQHHDLPLLVEKAGLPEGDFLEWIRR